MKQRRIVLSAGLVLVLMTMLLLYFNFKDAYLINLPQTDELTVELMERELEYSLNLGIDLEKYYGLDGVVESFESKYALSDGILISDAKGNVIYGGVGKVAWVEKSMQEIITSGKTVSNYTSTVRPEGFISLTQLNGSTGVEGYIVSSVGNARINPVVLPYLLKSILIYCVVIFAYLTLFKTRIRGAHVLRHIIAVQVLASIPRTYVYYESIRSSLLTQFGYIMSIVKDRLSVVSEYGMDLSNIRGVDVFVDSVADKIDAFENVRLVSGASGIGIQYDIASKFVMKILSASILDTFVLSVLLTFFFLEIINFYHVGAVEKKSHSPEILRGLGFSYFLGYYISVLFVPLRMLELMGAGRFLFEREIMMGLPVSLEAIVVGVSSIAVVRYVENKGFGNVFRAGVLFVILGFFLSYLTANPYMFILARMVVGLGHGICLIVMRGYVVTNPEQERIGEGVTAFSIGVTSSLNIGCVLGGIIGDYFGLRYVFIISGMFMVFPGLFSGLLVRGDVNPKKTDTRLLYDFMTLFKEQGLIISIILFMLPLRILSGYLEYFFPVVSTSVLGWSYSGVSRGYLLNSMIIILAGLNLVKFLSRRVSRIKRLYLGLIIMVSAVAIMSVTMNGTGMVLSLAVLSIPLAFMEGTFLEHYTGFQSTQNMGSMKSMAFYTLFDRAIMYIVPYVYAMILSGNVGTGLSVMLLAVLMAVCLIGLVWRWAERKRGWS